METQLLHQREVGGSIPTLPLQFSDVKGYEVRPIEKKDSHWLLLNVHYAHRIPSISYAFGLFLDNNLEGVITYGFPASNTLVEGICGKEYKDLVLELNRLCLVNNRKGEASRLIGQSLKMLPKPRIVVSFADSSQNHTGIVYQATNWIYTGLSAKRKEYAIKGMEHLHSKTISEMGKLSELKERFGDDFYYRDRSRKHRYIYFLGTKDQVKNFHNLLKYPPQPYPKNSVAAG